MSLLININVILSHDLPNLTKIIRPIPKSDMNVGVVMGINEKILNKLKSIQKGIDKLKYMDSYEFIINLNFHSYVFFNQQVCNLSKNSVNNMEVVIENTMRYLPNNLKLVYAYDTNKISTLLRNNFIKNRNTWVRVNDVEIKKSGVFKDERIKKDIYHNEICEVRVLLSKPTISYIKDLTMRGSFNTKGRIKQKELAGEMVVSRITKTNLHIIELDSNFIYGSGDSVRSKPSKITFHTHPDEAYTRNNVNNGWPSPTDYSTLIKFSLITDIVIHFVISNEGLYSVTFTMEWLKYGKYKKELDNIIKDHPSMEKQTTKTPEWHVNEVNKIKFNGIPIFKVYFFTWDNIQPFSVFFKNQDTNCKIIND